MGCKPIKLGVSGCLGKMGGRIMELAANDKDFRVVLALERTDHPEIGKKVAGLKVAAAPQRIEDVDGLIEFTSPEATLDHLSWVVKFGKAFVIGTTGLTDAQKKVVCEAAKKIPIVFSPNMSVGVNLLFHLADAASLRLPPAYRVRMTEAHHVHKKDAPSGTAKFLAEIIRKNRPAEAIDIRSIREGEIIGDHEVVFESPWDTITLKHAAKTRDIFALGALAALKFAVGKKSGLYSMADVIEGSK